MPKQGFAPLTPYLLPYSKISVKLFFCSMRFFFCFQSAPGFAPLTPYLLPHLVVFASFFLLFFVSIPQIVVPSIFPRQKKSFVSMLFSLLVGKSLRCLCFVVGVEIVTTQGRSRFPLCGNVLREFELSTVTGFVFCIKVYQNALS